MNYIHQLRAERSALQAELDALEDGIDAFRIFVLTNPKFGARPLLYRRAAFSRARRRLDWIATGDVARRLKAIREAAGKRPSTLEHRHDADLPRPFSTGSGAPLSGFTKSGNASTKTARSTSASVAPAVTKARRTPIVPTTSHVS